MEKGKHIFGVWLPDGPVIAVPPTYALSPFEVYHETAHLLTSAAATTSAATARSSSASTCGSSRPRSPTASGPGSPPRPTATTTTSGSAHRQGRVDGAGTEDDPIDVQGDLDLAARLIAEGKHVRLNRVDEIGTFVTKLAALVRMAEARGDTAPTYDLCKVTVPGTNLFCQQSMGIPRVKMPQLSGKPKPGSPADDLPRNERGNVNVKPLFRDWLIARGIAVEQRDVDSAWLKASQHELDGPAVGRIYARFAAGEATGSGSWVTRDGYIIDGHHQWAAQVAVDSDDGVLGDHKMTVQVVDLEIGEALTLAHQFSADQGITASGIGVNDTARASVDLRGSEALGLPADFRTTVSYRRDADGEDLPEGEAAIIAYDGDKPIAVLRWDAESETPTVVDVSVDEEYRRRGVATAMFEAARARQSNLQRSDVLLDDGAAFAAATPAVLVPDEKPARDPNFGKRIGVPERRPLAGGGYLLVEKLQGARPGQVVERVIFRVLRRDGVWGVYPPTEQSPAIEMFGSKREADKYADANA